MSKFANGMTRRTCGRGTEGSALTYAQLLARGFDLTGDAGGTDPGEPISMRLPKVVMPRSSIHAASGHAPNQPASACEKHAAQNNSLWEIAA